MDATLLTVLTFALVGFVVGWGLEFAIDFVYWRRRRARIVSAGTEDAAGVAATVSDTDDEMLRRALAERDEALMQARRNAASTGDELARTGLLLRDYELTISNLRQKLNQHQVQLERFQSSTPGEEVAARDVEISTLRAQLTSNQTAVEELQQQVSQRTVELDDLRAQLAALPEPADVDSLQAELDERMVAVERLASALAERQREADEIEAYLQQRDEEVKQLRRELNETTAELNALRQRELDRLVIEETEYIHEDDLTDIKGIGDVYEERLREAGYYTFGHLAEAEVEELKSALDIPDWRTPNLQSWIDQAREFVEQKEQDQEE